MTAIRDLNIEEQFRPYLWEFIRAFGFDFRLKNNKPGDLCIGFYHDRQLMGAKTEKAWVGLFLGVIFQASAFDQEPEKVLEDTVGFVRVTNTCELYEGEQS